MQCRLSRRQEEEAIKEAQGQIEGNRREEMIPKMQRSEAGRRVMW